MEERLVDVKDQTIPQQVLEFIPSNPFADMTGERRTSTLAVVIFSAFIGVAVLGLDRKKPQQAETFRRYGQCGIRGGDANRYTGAEAYALRDFSTDYKGNGDNQCGRDIKAHQIRDCILYRAGDHVYYSPDHYLAVWLQPDYVFEEGATNTGICLYVPFKCGGDPAECGDSDEETRRIGRHCEPVCKLWGYDWAKRLRRDLSGHAGGDDCSDGRHYTR